MQEYGEHLRKLEDRITRIDRIVLVISMAMMPFTLTLLMVAYLVATRA